MYTFRELDTLCPVHVPNKIWSQIGINLLAILKETENITFVITVINYFISYPEIIVLKTKSAKVVGLPPLQVDMPLQISTHHNFWSRKLFYSYSNSQQHKSLKSNTFILLLISIPNHVFLGYEFCNQLDVILFKLTAVCHSITSEYHPRQMAWLRKPLHYHLPQRPA